MLRALNRIFGYYLTLALFTHLADIKPEKREYHFSPLVKREEITLPASDVLNLYFDCDHKFYNSNRLKYTRTQEELEETVQKREKLEGLLMRYYNEQVALSHLTFYPIDTTKKWHDPLSGIGSFRNSFNDPRPRSGRRVEKHEATDILVPIGSYIYAFGNWIVLASSDDWTGEWNRKRRLHNSRGGLGDLTGNGILFFNVDDNSYYLMAHLRDVYVNAGDVVSAGTIVGTVGKTGNAISPRLRPHLHIAKKKRGESCGVKGTLVADNLFYALSENRAITIALKNGNTAKANY